MLLDWLITAPDWQLYAAMGVSLVVLALLIWSMVPKKVKYYDGGYREKTTKKSRFGRSRGRADVHIPVDTGRVQPTQDVAQDMPELLRAG